MRPDDFNAALHGHRKLLALAIDEFTRKNGCTQNPTKKNDGTSLLERLAASGTAISEATLDRIKRAPKPDRRDNYSAEEAREIALFLGAKGCFPPCQEAEVAFQNLSAFYRGFDAKADSMLDACQGEWVSYSYSNMQANKIISGRLTIGPRSSMNQAPVEETIEVIADGRFTYVYEGTAFSDGRMILYILTKERTLGVPRFYLFDGTARDASNNIETLLGTSLGAARHHSRHLTSVALYRGPIAPVKAVMANNLSKLPKDVAIYLSRELLPGPRNSRPLKGKPGNGIRDTVVGWLKTQEPVDKT